MEKEVIAIDLGGTNLRVALVRGRKIVKLIKNKTSKTKEGILKEIFEGIANLMNSNVKGIGVGTAGPVFNGVLLNPPNLPFRNYNIKDILKKKFKTRVEVENDAHCVALAELKYGVRKKNFFVLTLGTGIGGGIIIDGKLYSRGGLGGEAGSIVLDRGENFESLAGLKGIERLARKEFSREIDVKELVGMKDKRAKNVLNVIFEYYAQGIASLINIFDPEIVVLAGGLSHNGNFLLNRIRKSVGKYIAYPKSYKIVASKLNEPGILGAALLLD